MPTLSAPQAIFLNKLGTKFRAYVGGLGSGKSFVGCIDLLLFMSQHPKILQGYFGPTYPTIRDIFYPTFEEAADLLGFRIDVMAANKEVHVYRGRRYYGTVICRSMDKPSSIIGFKIARALVDEIDTLPVDKAKMVWNKIIARMRLKVDGVVNGIGVTTTPEGFMFVYEKFKKNPTESYSMVQASTYENMEYLPDDYIDSLYESYTPELVNAYIHGQFVNLRSGSVYYAFDRKKNATDAVHQPGEPVIVGMDFNVLNMNATVFVKRDGRLLAVDEVVKAVDTPQMADILLDRYEGCNISVRPDASGNNTSSKAVSVSDISILKSKGLSVKVASSNPFIKDRVHSVNNAFDKDLVRINVEKCPNVTEALEQQVYDKNGMPEKRLDNSIDDLCDNFGYGVFSEFPVQRRIIHATKLRGL